MCRVQALLYAQHILNSERLHRYEETLKLNTDIQANWWL